MYMEEVKKFGVAYFLAWGPEGRAKVDIFLPYELLAQSVGWLAGWLVVGLEGSLLASLVR